MEIVCSKYHRENRSIRINRASVYWGAILKGLTYVLQKDKIKKIMEKRIFVEIMDEIFLNLVKINKFTDSKNSTNLEQNNWKRNHIYVLYNETALNQLFKKENLESNWGSVALQKGRVTERVAANVLWEALESRGRCRRTFRMLREKLRTSVSLAFNHQQK